MSEQNQNTSLLTKSLDVMDGMRTQIDQMRGMFDDEDGAIENAINKHDAFEKSARKHLGLDKHQDSLPGQNDYIIIKIPFQSNLERNVLVDNMMHLLNVNGVAGTAFIKDEPGQQKSIEFCRLIPDDVERIGNILSNHLAGSNGNINEYTIKRAVGVQLAAELSYYDAPEIIEREVMAIVEILKYEHNAFEMINTTGMMSAVTEFREKIDQAQAEEESPRFA